LRSRTCPPTRRRGRTPRPVRPEESTTADGLCVRRVSPSVAQAAWTAALLPRDGSPLTLD